MLAGSQMQAAQLDAADGRMDGRFFGQPIGVATPQRVQSIPGPLMMTPVRQVAVTQPVAVTMPAVQCSACQPPPPPPQVQYVEVIKEVPGPIQIQYVEVVREVPGPVQIQYVEVIKEVPGPERVKYVEVEVPGPVRVETVEVQVPGPVQYVQPPPPKPVPKPVPKKVVSQAAKSVTRVYESYRVGDLKTGITLSTKDGTDDAEYDGRPIQVGDLGLLRDIYMANGVVSGMELLAMLNAGHQLRPVTVHSKKRAMLVYCHSDWIKAMESKSMQRESMMGQQSRARVALQAMQTLLVTENDWKQAFAQLDKNQDGIISNQELMNFLRWLSSRNPAQYGHIATPAVVEDFMRIFDADGNGKLEVAEFLWHVRVPKGQPNYGKATGQVRQLLEGMNRFLGKNMAHLWKVFVSLDEDGDHVLSEFEIENLICMMAMADKQYEPFRSNSKALAKSVMDALDRKGTRNLDFTDLFQLCRSPY